MGNAEALIYLEQLVSGWSYQRFRFELLQRSELLSIHLNFLLAKSWFLKTEKNYLLTLEGSKLKRGSKAFARIVSVIKLACQIRYSATWAGTGGALTVRNNAAYEKLANQFGNFILQLLLQLHSARTGSCRDLKPTITHFEPPVKWATNTKIDLRSSRCSMRLRFWKRIFWKGKS